MKNVKNIKRKKNNKNNQNLKVIAITVIFTTILCLIASGVILNNSAVIQADAPAAEKTTQTTTEATTKESFFKKPTTTKPTEPYVVSKATIGSAGDVLIHIPILNNAKKSDGSYDFSHLFTYAKSVMSKCDYFVANLETTLGGTDGRSYAGYPCFNSPDSIVSALKGAGTDMLLTANNHTYDTRGSGVLRTLSVIEKQGLDYIGTRIAEEKSRYIVKNVNDIKFGFTCYTYETESSGTALNGIAVDSETAKLINSFDYNDLGTFYHKLQSDIDNMKKDGADVITVYIHWGEEYQLTQNGTQKLIAQKLCDMGVDVIVGGHPHVLQPTEVLTSTDGKRKTYCLYSLGNMVSNQRRAYMGLKTGHTEDGLIFTMSFSKYSDGKVTFDKVELIPTWVHMYKENGKTIHSVVPLKGDLDSNYKNLGLHKTSDGLSLAKQSLARTKAIVGELVIKKPVK